MTLMLALVFLAAANWPARLERSGPADPLPGPVTDTGVSLPPPRAIAELFRVSVKRFTLVHVGDHLDTAELVSPSEQAVFVAVPMRGPFINGLSRLVWVRVPSELASAYVEKLKAAEGAKE